MANVGFATLQVIPSLRGLDASLTKGFAPAQGIAASQGTAAGKAFGGKFGNTLKGILPGSLGGLSLATGGIVAAGAAVGTLIGFGVKAAASFQQTRIAFEGILGSAGKADKFLDEMRDFAAKTPFEFPELADSAKNLLAVGFAAEDVIPTMTTLGNVAATLGVGGPEIQGVVRALGQMKGKGKASAEELQQISEQLPGFSAINAIAKDMGVSVPEAFKLMEKGAIPADRAIAAILNGMKKFPGAAGAMERQSKTLNGVMSTFKDTMRDVLVDAIEPLLPALSAGLTGLTPVLQTGLKVFTDAITDALPVLLDLFRSVANAASGLLPVLTPVGLAAAGLFKAALPIMQLFADDLNTIGDALHAIPAPILAGAGALGLLALAALGAADGLIAAGIAAGKAAIAFAFTPIGAAVLAFGALVTAVTLFRRSAGPSKKDAQELSNALFDGSKGAAVFADGISGATEGLREFITQQIAAGKNDRLQDVLLASHTNVSDLARALVTGGKEWEAYSDQVLKASLASGESKFELAGQSDALKKQRDAFRLATSSQLKMVVSSGQLTNAQIRSIKAVNKNADGTVNWGRVLDAVDTKLGSLAAKTDAAAQSAAQSTPLYSALVDQFASGRVSADEFAGVLQNKFKLSADGAKDAAKRLGEQVKELESAVDSSFPAIADAAKGLKNDVVGVAADLASRQSKFAKQLAESERLGSGASETLRENISENLKGIRDDFKVLANNSDPQKFTENLLKQVQTIANFFTNIKSLVQQGFPELARTLLNMGAEAGGSLAAGFAAQPTKAKVSEAALGVLSNTKGEMKAWVLNHFGELSGIGGSVVDGVAFGIAVNPNAKNAAVRMVDGVKSAMRGQFRVSSPSKWARDVIGKNVVLGVAEGLDPSPLDASVRRIRDHLELPISAKPRLTLDRTTLAPSQIPKNLEGGFGGVQVINNFNGPFFGNRREVERMMDDVAQKTLRKHHVPTVRGAA